MNRIQKLVAGAIVALSFTISAANAQDWNDGYQMGPWMMGQNGMMNGQPMGPGMMGNRWNRQGGSMCGMMNYQIGGRLAYLKTELEITSEQEPLWTAYAEAVRNNSKTMASRCTTMMGGGNWNSLSLPDRLARHEQFMAAQVEALRVIDKSLKPLYATFSDSQKQAADQLIWCPMGMM